MGNESLYKEICYTICGVLSAVGCVMIILSGTLIKSLNNYTFRLVVYLAFADLFASLSIQ